MASRPPPVPLEIPRLRSRCCDPRPSAIARQQQQKKRGRALPPYPAAAVLTSLPNTIDRARGEGGIEGGFGARGALDITWAASRRSCIATTLSAMRRRQTQTKRERALQLRDTPTAAEALLWSELKKLDAHFTRQWVIEGFIVDFCCRRARLVVELDGAVHANPEQAAHDVARDRVLVAAGYRVARFSNDEVFARPAQVASAIQRLCSADDRR